MEANGSEDFSKALVNTTVYGHEDIVGNIVVEKKGDVEVKDKNLLSPLHSAAYMGHLPIVQLLVENNAQVSVSHLMTVCVKEV